jgi:hypothetical protein
MTETALAESMRSRAGSVLAARPLLDLAPWMTCGAVSGEDVKP